MYIKPCLKGYSAEMILDKMGTVQAASVEFYIQSVPFAYNNIKAESVEAVQIAKADNKIVHINEIG